MKPKFFLLDAGPVIELHRLALWQAVAERAELIVPAYVAGQETQYWKREDGSRPVIELGSDAAAGSITLADCDAAELLTTMNLFDTAIQQSIDAGELHALVLLRRWTDEESPRFCTGDRMATVALCLMGFARRAVALEMLLGELGLNHAVRAQFSSARMELWLRDGQLRRLQSMGRRP